MEPALLPVHGLRYRSSSSSAEFASTVEYLAHKWERENAYLGRSAVLEAFKQIYATDMDSVELGTFVKHWTSTGHESATPKNTLDPTDGLWTTMRSHPIAGVVLGWYEMLEVWQLASRRSWKKLAEALAEVRQKWPESVEPLKKHKDLAPLADRMEDWRWQLESAAEWLEKPEKARKTGSHGGQAGKKRQKDLLSFREARRILLSLANDAARFAQLEIIGSLEAHLIASFAEKCAQVLDEPCKETEEFELSAPVATVEHDEKPTNTLGWPKTMAKWAAAVIGLTAVVVGMVLLFGKRPEPRQSVVKIQHSTGSGTGFLIDAERAWIVTNRHVVMDEQIRRIHSPLKVTFENDKSFAARVLDVSADQDLALLEIINPPTSRHLGEPLRLGSSQHLNIGDEVLVIGHPAGEDFSQFYPRVGQLDKSEGVFRLDGSLLDAGCSGAPVLDSDHRVVGVVNALTGQYTKRPRVIMVEHLREFIASRVSDTRTD